MAEQRRTPKQQRSRDRVEAILSAAEAIIREDGLDALTIREVEKRTEIPAATIYRYFSDRDEIAASFLDRVMEQLDLASAEAVLKLERVSMRGLMRAALFSQLRYLQDNPSVAEVWFGEPRSPLVLRRIREMEQRSANWLSEAVTKTGMLASADRAYKPEIFTRLGDRAMEFVVTSDLTRDEQDLTLEQYVDMVATFIERYATPRGIDGVPTAEFFAALDQHPTHLKN